MIFKKQSIKNWLEKLQALPESQKKIILWTIIAVLAIIMGAFWTRNLMNNAIPKINEELRRIELPNIKAPDMPKMPSLDALEDIVPSEEQSIN